MLPIDMGALASGVKWPTLDLDLVGEDLLAPNLGVAATLKSAFERLRPDTAFDVIYLRSPDVTSPMPKGDVASLLGYDVASPAPYYSVLGDIDPASPVMMEVIPLLNSAGLIPTKEFAEDYLENCRRAQMGDIDDTFQVWEVWDTPGSKTAKDP